MDGRTSLGLLLYMMMMMIQPGISTSKRNEMQIRYHIPASPASHSRHDTVTLTRNRILDLSLINDMRRNLKEASPRAPRAPPVGAAHATSAGSLLPRAARQRALEPQQRAGELVAERGVALLVVDGRHDGCVGVVSVVGGADGDAAAAVEDAAAAVGGRGRGGGHGSGAVCAGEERHCSWGLACC